MRNNTIPLALSFRNCKIKEFKMFENSCKGDIKIETSEFDPQKMRSNYVRDPYIEDSMLVFIDDSKLCIIMTPERYTYEYRFEKDVLKIYDSQRCRWLIFGYGDKKKIVVVKGVTKDERLPTSNKLKIQNEDDALGEKLEYTELHSIDEKRGRNMKIYWCNIHYTFQ